MKLICLLIEGQVNNIYANCHKSELFFSKLTSSNSRKLKIPMVHHTHNSAQQRKHPPALLPVKKGLVLPQQFKNTILLCS